MTDKDYNHSKIDRRDYFRAMTALGLSSLLPANLSDLASQEQFAPNHGDLIKEENSKPGTRDWILTKTDIDPSSKYRSPYIEGYASHISVSAGQQISLYVSCNPESSFYIDVYRSGFYGGLGGRQVASLGTFKGKTQPDPSIGERRLRECAWDACQTLTIPNDWVSGVYLCKLTAENSDLQSYITFLVKDNRKTDFLFQCSDTTWNAYNRWPSQFSLYDNEETVWY